MPRWEPSLEEVPAASDSADRDVLEIRKAMADLAKIGTAEGRIVDMTDEVWQQRCDALLAAGNQGSFKAAEPRRHIAAYQEYRQQPAPFRRGLKRNSRWEPKLQTKILREGLRLDFVKPKSASQQSHPQF